jgi:hypothetical protein
MEPRNQRFKSFQVKRTLDDLIERGVELNKKNILDAETIDYKKVENELFSYDEFGFLDKYNDKNDIKK